MPRSRRGTANHRPRLLVFTFENDMEGRSVRATADTDETLASLHAVAVSVHTDAWLLYARRSLPAWWRLVRDVRAECFRDGRRDLVAWPMSEAAVRASGLRLAPLPYETEGWRIAKTGRHAGKAFKITEHRTTSQLVQGEPDDAIRNPGAFTADPDQASIAGVAPELWPSLLTRADKDSTLPVQ